MLKHCIVEPSHRINIAGNGSVCILPDRACNNKEKIREYTFLSMQHYDYIVAYKRIRH